MSRSWNVETSGTPSRYVCVLFSNHMSTAGFAEIVLGRKTTMYSMLPHRLSLYVFLSMYQTAVVVEASYRFY